MQRQRDLGIALSLANLCFYVVWAELLPGSPKLDFLKAPPPAMAFAAVAVNIAVLAVVFWAGTQAVRRSRSTSLRTLARGAFLVTVAFAVNGLRLKLPRLGLTGLSGWLGHSGLVAVAVGLAIGALFALVRWSATVARAVATMVLMCVPFVVVTFGRAMWALIDGSDASASFRELALVPAVTREAWPQRVLWMIFDELDERLAFSARPPDVLLPELDRFRSEALFATQAYPPSGQTLVSLPALLNGTLIATAWPAGASDLRISLDGAKRAERWSTQDTVFAAAQQSGHSSALVGWYHPYCRVIGGLTHCSWQEWKSTAGATLREQAAQQIARLAETIPHAQQLGLLRAVALLEPASGALRRRQFAVERISIPAFMSRQPDLVVLSSAGIAGVTAKYKSEPESDDVADQADRAVSWRRSTGEPIAFEYARNRSFLEALEGGCLGYVLAARFETLPWLPEPMIPSLAPEIRIYRRRPPGTEAGAAADHCRELLRAEGFSGTEKSYGLLSGLGGLSLGLIPTSPQALVCHAPSRAWAECWGDGGKLSTSVRNRSTM